MQKTNKCKKDKKGKELAIPATLDFVLEKAITICNQRQRKIFDLCGEYDSLYEFAKNKKPIKSYSDAKLILESLTPEKRALYEATFFDLSEMQLGKREGCLEGFTLGDAVNLIDSFISKDKISEICRLLNGKYWSGQKILKYYAVVESDFLMKKSTLKTFNKKFNDSDWCYILKEEFDVIVEKWKSMDFNHGYPTHNFDLREYNPVYGNSKDCWRDGRTQIVLSIMEKGLGNDLGDDLGIDICKLISEMKKPEYWLLPEPVIEGFNSNVRISYYCLYVEFLNSQKVILGKARDIIKDLAESEYLLKKDELENQIKNSGLDLMNLLRTTNDPKYQLELLRQIGMYIQKEISLAYSSPNKKSSKLLRMKLPVYERIFTELSTIVKEPYGEIAVLIQNSAIKIREVITQYEQEKNNSEKQEQLLKSLERAANAFEGAQQLARRLSSPFIDFDKVPDFYVGSKTKI